VIEVQLVRCIADDAPPSVSTPDSQLHGCRDDPTPTGIGRRRLTQVFFSLDGDALELEHLPLVVFFLPEIHDVESAVIRPYALLQLFVNSHLLGWSSSILVVLGSLGKPAVLCRSAVGGATRLIDGFRTGKRIAPRLIDAYLLGTAFRGQRSREPKPATAPSTLFKSETGDDRIHGDFTHIAKKRSLYTWLQTHPVWYGALKTVGALTLIGSLTGCCRPEEKRWYDRVR